MNQATPRILLVEDDSGIRRFVRLALEDEGWQVFEAETAKRGLIEAASRQPDAVIACVGGGSNAIGIFHPYIEVEGVRLIGVEAGGHGVERAGHDHAAALGDQGAQLLLGGAHNNP